MDADSHWAGNAEKRYALPPVDISDLTRSSDPTDETAYQTLPAGSFSFKPRRVLLVPATKGQVQRPTIGGVVCALAAIVRRNIVIDKLESKRTPCKLPLQRVLKRLSLSRA